MRRPKIAYLPALDGIRGIGMLIVIAVHTGVGLFANGIYALDSFFVLSGFLITTLLLEEQRATGEVSLRLFWLRRVARLIPALLVGCLILLVVTGINAIHPVRPVLNPYPAKTTLIAVAVALSYMASWIRAIFHTDLGPFFQTWSLSVEEWFYVLWPLLLIALLRRRRSITAITVALAVVALAYRLVSESLISSKWYLFFAPDERAFELLLGCAIAVVLFHYHDLVAAHTRLVSWCGIVGVATLAVLMARPVHEDAVHHAAVPWEHFGIPIAALASTALVVCVVLQPEHRIARALSLKPLLWVGRRSYGLYIYHLPILVLVSPLSGPEGRVPWRTGLISMALLFSAAAASYRWLERPAMRWMRDREERVRAAPATSPVAEPALGGILASGAEA